MHARLVWIPLLLAGCVEELSRGPDPGPCAAPPESGAFTWGEVGIGTCLSGPSDLVFFEQGGRTWLAVTNANPYRDFLSGSVLTLDWGTVDPSLAVNPIDSLTRDALALESDLSGLGWVEDRELLLAAGRFSEGASTTVADDTVFVIDASAPSDLAPWLPEEGGDALTVEDDPIAVAVHDAEGRAYVVNFTDRSVSVIDTTTTPLTVVDVAGDARLTPERFLDADGSGSLAEISDVEIVAHKSVPTDSWTLSWLDATYTLFVPTDGGLARWSSGGLAWRPSPRGIEIDPGDTSIVDAVDDPYAIVTSGLPSIWYENDGAIERIDQAADLAGTWSFDLSFVALAPGAGWDAVRGAPAPVQLGTRSALYYDGRASADAPAAIGLAIFDGTSWVARGAPVLEAPAGHVSIEDPFVRADTVSTRVRMWASLWDGERWTVGLAESAEGEVWGDVEEVLAVEGADVAAPVVVHVGGRYVMWVALGDGARWDHAWTWSWDGRTWNDLEVVVPGSDAFDPMRPPRVAAIADPTLGWRVEGESSGVAPGHASAGASFTVPRGAFAFRPASGHAFSNELVGASAEAALLPGSIAEIDGVLTLYATATDATGRSRIVALQPMGESWAVVADDAVPRGVGGNVDGASEPVVTGTTGAYTMYWSGTDAAGVLRMYRATSLDGLDWAPLAEPLLPDGSDWDAAARLPHALEPLVSGGYRLWYAGFDGSRWRIGTATSPDGISFTREPGATDPWQLGPGAFGSFDVAGVRDPWVTVIGDTLHLVYAGFDGTAWNIGHATRPVSGGEFTRAADPLTGVVRPVLAGTLDTFSAAGVDHPVALPGAPEFWYAGTDGVTARVGRAIGAVDDLYAAQRFPTAGDTLRFDSVRGGRGPSTDIELSQLFDDLATPGTGAVAARLDEERGFLFVASSSSPWVYVLDVRDDTDDGFTDANYLDIEAVLLLGEEDETSGFRDALPIPGTSLLYATATSPESLVVFDLAGLVDDAARQVIRGAPVAVFSLQALTTPTQPKTRFGQQTRRDEDEGEDTLARIGGARMALSGELLLVPHFRENALYVFDLGRGAWGEPIRLVRDVGENPHVVAVSPDGRSAVIAAYVGELVDGHASSQLTVVDLDPASATFLEVTTRITNQ